MTREIKFRAWDKENKRMWYQDNLPNGYDGDVHRYQAVINKYGEFSVDEEIHDGSRWKFVNRFYTDNNELIMQYTGLKDKNGVEIYEGDIVESLDRIFGGNGSTNRRVVEFKNGCFELDTVRLSILNEQAGGGLTFEPVVIGNIYQNPELLQ